MSDLVRAIIIMSLSGSILAILLFIFKPLVRNRLPKSTQYYLWLVVILALLIPVPKIAVLLDNQTAAIPVIPIVQVAPAIPTISETVTRFVITQEEANERLQGIAHLANTSEYLQERQAIESPIALVTTYFILIYPFGVLLLGLWYVFNYMFFAKMYRRRNIIANEEYRKILAQMCKGRAPRLHCNPLAATPMLLGIFRPVIILPDKAYTAEQLQAIFSHELTHLRRKDIFVKWLMLIASALHWFNPLIWLIRREIDRACELSCDEAVIRNLDIDGKRNYGNTLIAVSANSKAPRAIASATMCEEKKNLKERLGAIMKSKKHTRIVLALSVLLIFLAACGALTLGGGSGNSNGPEGNNNASIIETTPEDPPRLYARLIAGDSPIQRIRALQLVTNWSFTNEDGYSSGIMFDSPHPLQLSVSDYNDVTLFLDYATAEILVEFHQNYPPDYITVRRWQAEPGQPNEEDFDNWEEVEVNGLAIPINNGGHNYIYEVTARWPGNDSFSTYAFRIVSTMSEGTVSRGVANLRIDIRSNELLNQFDSIYDFDFLPAFARYWGAAIQDYDWINEDSGVIIWSDQPLHNLQVVMIGHDFDTNETLSYVSATLHEIDVLMPGTALLLSRFIIVGGVIPHEGISFEDASGQRRNFAIVDERRDTHAFQPYFFQEFENMTAMFPPVYHPSTITPGSPAASLTWVVEPTLPHTSLQQCNCGAIVTEEWQHVDTITGRVLPYSCGHGGPPPPWVYDPERGLFGHAGYGNGYHMFVGMHPINEFSETIHDMFGYDNIFADWLLMTATGLSTVEAVDSSLRANSDWFEGGWHLLPEGASGTFAIMYNLEFITDFIFSGVGQWQRDFAIVQDFPLISMRMSDMWGLVDRNGNTVFPFMFENLIIIDESTAFAKYNGRYGILDFRATISN